MRRRPFFSSWRGRPDRIRRPESLGPWLHGVAVPRGTPRKTRSGSSQSGRTQKGRNARMNVTPRTSGRNHGPRRASRRDRSASRKIPAADHPLLLARPDPDTGSPNAGLAAGNRSDSPAPRPGATAVKADAPGCRPDRCHRLATSRPRSRCTPGILGRDWTETTARAAIRFAAGKETAGLVAPPVSGLAESVLTGMLADSLKVVALMVISLVLISAGLVLHRALATSTASAPQLLMTSPATGSSHRAAEPALAAPILKRLRYDRREERLSADPLSGST